MAQSREFFEDRVREAAEEARNATLVNVRERALRSAAAWREMADRATRIENDREERRQRQQEREEEALVAKPG